MVSVFGNVRPDEGRIAAELFDFIDDLRTLFFAATGQNDLGAAASEFDRSRFADARSSSGHQHNFAWECSFHLAVFLNRIAHGENRSPSYAHAAKAD
jgi:hypothetical protein